MEKKFELVLSDELFDKTKHSHYHYYKTILENTRDINLSGVSIFPACNFDKVSKEMKALGANLTEIKYETAWNTQE